MVDTSRKRAAAKQRQEAHPPLVHVAASFSCRLTGLERFTRVKDGRAVQCLRHAFRWWTLRVQRARERVPGRPWPAFERESVGVVITTGRPAGVACVGFAADQANASACRIFITASAAFGVPCSAAAAAGTGGRSSGPAAPADACPADPGAPAGCCPSAAPAAAAAPALAAAAAGPQGPAARAHGAPLEVKPTPHTDTMLTPRLRLPESSADQSPPS